MPVVKEAVVSTAMYERVDAVMVRLSEYHLRHGDNMFMHETIMEVPMDNLNAQAKLRQQFPQLTIWRYEMLWPGSGWRMRLGNLRLILHMLWCWLRTDQDIRVRLWGRWFSRHWLKTGGTYHQTYWMFDDTQRVCGVECSCGRVFAQRTPTWIFPRKEVRV